MKNLKKLGCVSLLSLAVVLASCDKPVQSVGKKIYKTMEIARTDTFVSSGYTASIRGEQYVDIRPQVSGVITDILIPEGAEVKAGQKLFIIDQVPYRAALSVAIANVKSAESKVATAKLNSDSCKDLLAEGIISENEQMIAQNTLAEAEAALALAVAQEQIARNDLSYTEVKSPVSGVASMISYRVGALVSSSITDPLVSVTNNDRMYAYFSMSESHILGRIREVGSTDELVKSLNEVSLQLSDGELYSLTGSVDAISGTVDQTTGSVTLRAVFENPDEVLRDGGSGRIMLKNKYDNAIVIPKVATFEIQNKIFVYKIIDGKSSSAEVKVLPIDNGRDYIILSGLAEGETILAEGAGLMREGTPVTDEAQEAAIAAKAAAQK